MAAIPSPIPDSYDQLVREHSALVRWAVNRILKPHRFATHDINDVVQDVFVKLLEVDYLSRCRAYASTVGAYRFSNSLAVLARNVAVSYLRAQGVRARYRGPSLDEPDQLTQMASAFDSDRGVEAARLHAATAAKLQLSSLRSQVDGIAFGGATIGTLIDTALAHDGQLTEEAVAPLNTRVKYARRRLREVAVRAAGAEATL
jgi:DNA-directed RNA polymerase specialized sigma24 family protein